MPVADLTAGTIRARPAPAAAIAKRRDLSIAVLIPCYQEELTVATRLHTYDDKSFRPFHVVGNKLVCGIINWMFKTRISDIFSGYRAFTRDAAAQIPITARGFDVETELTLQALYRGLVVKEMSAPYRARPEGSFSKLRTVSDGFLVILKLFLILKSYKPLTFFGLCSVGLMALGLAAGARPIYEYLTKHYIYAVPSAILAAALMLLASFTLGLGLILNSTNLRLLELEKLICKRLATPRPFAGKDEQTL